MEERKASSQWGSRLGFMVAALGSALGLGSLWRFPYIAAENGGGLFVLVYLIFIVLLGVPLMAAEMAIGRSSQSSPVRAYGTLATKHKRAWQSIGALGVITGVLILSYYSVVAGWSLDYFRLSLTGGLPTSNDIDAFKGVFGELLKSPGTLLFWHVVVMLCTAWVVGRGVKGGIEQVTEWLMAILFLILIVLLGYSMTLPTFIDSVKFVFGFHAEDFTSESVLEAAGHAFFTLSLGMGAMLTYGSYLDKRSGVLSTAVLVSVMDTVASLVACLVVFPVTLNGGITELKEGGPGLVFNTLPLSAQALPFGGVWISVVFALLFVAALASTVSLLEVPVSVLIDSFGLARRKATALAAGVITLLGTPAALSWTPGFFSDGMTKIFGKSWFDLVDSLSANWFLSLGALGTCLFIAFAMDRKQLAAEFVRNHEGGRKLFQLWFLTTTVVSPIIIVVVFLKTLNVF